MTSAQARATPRSRWVHPFRDTERWTQLVAATLKATPLCQKCKGQRRRTAAVDVVHIKTPWNKELFFSVDNIQSVCADHRGMR